jgi:hypothetical protein
VAATRMFGFIVVRSPMKFRQRSREACLGSGMKLFSIFP